MMVALALLVAGAAFCLVVLALLRVIAPGALPRLLVASASGGLVGACWLSVIRTGAVHKGALFGAGFLIVPFCLLPVTLRLSGKIEGLSRAAAGLGMGRSARIRHLWLPLLRLPVALSGLCFAICLTLCLFLASFTHG
ncbi:MULTISPECIES: hypothetical protein [Asaia]|uniref:hypothetical protein n=1 Tax=Asaia TaxID=91914 RepID=UPI002FC3B931